jgi:hypothetical protein
VFLEFGVVLERPGGIFGVDVVDFVCKYQPDCLFVGRACPSTANAYLAATLYVCNRSIVMVASTEYLRLIDGPSLMKLEETQQALST